MNSAKPIFNAALAALAILLLFAAASARNGQSEAQQRPAEITREDDRLPFMQQENTPAVEDEPSSAMLMAKSLGALMLIVGLIFFGAWGARKLGFGNAKPETADAVELSVVNTLSLGAGRSLVAVNFEGRTLLVGSTANAFTLIAEKHNSAEHISKPRSVAEMLEEEGVSFRREFEAAQERMPSDEVRS